METVSPTAHIDALSKAKIGLMARPDSVFFTTICFSLKYVWDETIPTAAVDGVSMFISPKFFLSMSPEERIFVLVHEAMHVALLHICRLLGRNPQKFNIAADHVINLMLLARGFKMPDWVLKDPKYIGLSTDEVYKLLPDDPEPPGGRKMGGDIKAAPKDQDAEKVEAHVKDILVRAQIQSRMAGDKPGTIPGDIEIFLERLLNPKLPWHRILQKYMQAFAKTDYSFRKPNRRFFPKHYLPSLHGTALVDIAIAVDTSASVTDKDFNRFVSEIASILKMMKPDKITLVQFDTQIKSVNVVKSVLDLMKVRFTGRGGTQIKPVLDWVNANKPQVMLVFTDGGFYFYTTETKVPVVWLINGTYPFNPPFGKTIRYEI